MELNLYPTDNTCFDSPAGEWLWWWAAFGHCWWSLSLAHQQVSGLSGELHLYPADYPFSWLSSRWATSVVICIWTLLTTPVLGSLGSECILWWAAFGLCWQHLSLIMQQVSGFCGKLHLDSPVDDCPWLSRKSVSFLVTFIWILLMIFVLGSLVCEWLLWWGRF